MTNKLHHTDCIRFMYEKVEDESIDLIVSDPPYLIDYQSNRRKKLEKFKKIKNDTNVDKNIDLISDYFTLCEQKLKQDSSIYIFCDYKTIETFKILFERSFKLKNVLIWKKNHWGMGDLAGSYAHQYEMIMYGHKGRDLLRNKRHPDVLEFDKISGQNLLHPTEKPTDLLRFLITNSSDIGDLVFDGFAGSGSTLIAAKETNRNYLGCEIDFAWYEIASSRLEQPLQLSF